MFKLVILSFVGISAAIALLPHLLYLVVKGLSLVCHFNVNYKPYGYAALALVGLWLIGFCYGHWFGRYRHEIKQVEIPCKGLPKSFDNYKIVHISDLHLDGWEGHEDGLSEIVSEINSLNPDLIVFTGDIVSLSKDELTPFIPILKQLKSKNGVISIMGNHDYLPYDKSISEKERWAQVREVEQMEREGLGWNMLLNQHTFLHKDSDSIAVIGCENQSMGVHNVVVRGKLREAAKDTEGCYPLILTHDPTHWHGEVLDFFKNCPSSLTLSGHTHGGQFRVFGFSVASFIYKEYDGLYTDGSQHLYVNIGLGGTMPMRIGATPEVTLITLKSTNQ